MKSAFSRVIYAVSILTILCAGCATKSPVTQGECPDASIVHVAIKESAESLDFNSIATAADEYSIGLLGLAEQNAEKCVTSETLIWRIIGRDGEYFPVTLDYSPSRINVVIDSGIVAEVSVG